MAFTVNTDIASLEAQHYLRVTQDFQSVQQSKDSTLNRIVAVKQDEVTPPTANASTTETVGEGANTGISDLTSAQAAGALADAINLLSSAQAGIGGGQNQFSFAIDLAQSQPTGLAAESAKLTKSQILMQAGIAALAQANSAPEQVLALLREVRTSPAVDTTGRAR